MLYQDALRLLPELFLATSLIVLLMYGVFAGDSKTRSVVILSFATLVAVAVLVWRNPVFTSTPGIFFPDISPPLSE